MTINVLAVDDSRTMRDMIALALRDQGFDVTVAEDGIHGLEVLEDVDPDVIITDINMPRMDGFGFIDAVRNRDRSRMTPILVLTTESSAELKARARNAGATGWIVKPFNPPKLQEIARKLCPAADPLCNHQLHKVNQRTARQGERVSGIPYDLPNDKARCRSPRGRKQPRMPSDIPKASSAFYVGTQRRLLFRIEHLK